MVPQHGKQTEESDIERYELDELLDLIERLHDYSRAGTFDERGDEMALWDETREVLRRYRPAALLTS